MPHVYPKIFKYKRYPHIDNRVHWQEVRSQIEKPDYIIHHAFYPFIHYKKRMRKFPKKFLSPDHPEQTDRDAPKERDIMYSAHIDRYIYEYYSYQINKRYNDYASQTGINRCAVAYRNNHPGKSNIHYAKEAFDFIRKAGSSFIVIGDFTKYFDNIDHDHLKHQLCKLLSVDRLPEDYYAVFRSITKYSWLELDEIQEFKGLDKKSFNKLDRIFSPEEFRLFKKDHLKTNRNRFGIPQGSAVSATLSNVYLMDFDKIINDYATSHAGFYRRYCDDFIIVLPLRDKQSNQRAIDFIFHTQDSIKGLELQAEKTQVFEYDSQTINNCNESYLPDTSNSKNLISYLGFTFDGQTVTIRSKTIAKYYERMYRKIDNITKNNRLSPSGKRIPLRNLYRLYSYKGKHAERRNKKQENFLSYVDRAKKVFGTDEDIDRGTKRAWSKMQKRLKRPRL